ncbi:chromate transporter [Treponema sp.]|uniref:chromate transporter n=1 Tax=Treponema sp. TaxID=166 RepID=UPI00389106D3
MDLIKKLITLYVTFFKIGSITFGGGLTMLPILERELIDNKKWTTSEELLDYYAIAQSTPGIIAVNVSTFVGHKISGIPGAVAATLGMVSPSIIIIVCIAEFIASFDSIPWVRKAMRGINVGVSALLTYSVINLFKKTVKKWWNLILYILAFVAVYFFHVRTIFVILSAAVLGIFIHVVDVKKGEAGE